MAFMSSSSRIWKVFGYPRRKISSRRNFTQKEWIVQMKSLACSPPMRLLIRWRISAAALLVKVRHSMLPGSIPSSSTRYAYLCASTRVLPEPAPAMILTLPSVAFTACSCLSFSPLSSIYIYPIGLQIYQILRESLYP